MDARVDLLVVDTAHGHSEGVLQMIGTLREKYPDMQLVGGNVATEAEAKALIERGVDAGQGRRRPWQHLHDPDRHGRRRAAGHRDRRAASPPATRPACR